jgi:hypothetical protein
MHDNLSEKPLVIGVIATGADKDVATAWAFLEAWAQSNRIKVEFYPKTIVWTGSSDDFIKAVDEFIMKAGPISDVIVSTQNLDEALCGRVESVALSHGLNFEKL